MKSEKIASSSKVSSFIWALTWTTMCYQCWESRVSLRYVQGVTDADVDADADADADDGQTDVVTAIWDFFEKNLIKIPDT